MKPVTLNDIPGGFIINEGDGSYIAVCAYDKAEAAAEKYAEEHDFEFHAFYYINGWKEAARNILLWYRGKLEAEDKERLLNLMEE